MTKKYLISILILTIVFAGCLQGEGATDTVTDESTTPRETTVPKKTVPIDIPEGAGSVESPIEFDSETTVRGKIKYGTFCTMCHGFEGKGGEEVTKNFEVDPANLVSEDVKQRTDGELFFIISNGVNGTNMLPWGEVLSEDERWQIISYVRVLQDNS